MNAPESAKALDDQGTEYLVQGEYEKAMNCFLQASGQGYYLSMYNIACMYYFGDGVDRDEARALEWYEKAAEHGDPEGANHVGIMLQDGLGCDPDKEAACRYFERAAEGGSLGGMANLGLCLLNGTGTAPDKEAGLAWMQRASEGGNGIASVLLGDWNRDGMFVGEKDPAAAKNYYERGMEQKYAPAVLALADLYEKGLGVPADEDKAAELRKLAEHIEDDID